MFCEIHGRPFFEKSLHISIVLLENRKTIYIYIFILEVFDGKSKSTTTMWDLTISPTEMTFCTLTPWFADSSAVMYWFVTSFYSRSLRMVMATFFDTWRRYCNFNAPLCDENYQLETWFQTYFKIKECQSYESLVCISLCYIIPI